MRGKTILKLTKKKKIAFSILAATASAAVLVYGALAIFTARTNASMSASTGNVSIMLDAPTITNGKNINPGDNDPTLAQMKNETTAHDLAFTIFNKGNKSIRTRQTIVLSCLRKSDNTVLDARYLSLYDSNGQELNGKQYITDNNTCKKALGSADHVKAVEYVLYSNTFDGTGNNAQIIDDKSANTVHANTSGSVYQDYSYHLALLKEANNKYQNAAIQATVIEEAMQYEKTTALNWSSMSQVEKTISTAQVKTSLVPAENENKNGVVFTGKDSVANLNGTIPNSSENSSTSSNSASVETSVQ